MAFACNVCGLVRIRVIRRLSEDSGVRMYVYTMGDTGREMGQKSDKYRLFPLGSFLFEDDTVQGTRESVPDDTASKYIQP